MNATTDAATPSPTDAASRSAWETLRLLWPHVWRYRRRVAVAFVFLAAAKVALVGSSLVLARLVDGLNVTPRPEVLPLAFLVGYGIARLSATLFQELRQVVFARVMARSSRLVARRVFEHLHALSLRFHLERRTGAVSRDLERGMSAISDLLDWTIYTIAPTLLEIVLVTTILAVKFDLTFPAITLATIAVYAVFTFRVTEWRLRWYRAYNEADTQANARAVDSLLNYETVKYFDNEAWESRRYDEGLVKLEDAMVQSLKRLSVLNVGQSAIVAVGLALLLWRAAAGVVEGRMSIGDLVMVNAFLLQLAAPLNFLGMVYREVKQALTNIERMFNLLEEPQEVRNLPDAPPLPQGGGSVRFEGVDFGYDPRRQVLHGVDFEIPAGHTLAVVGATGSGKSTLARLLFRFFDVTGGRIVVEGRDIREVDQASLRRAIGIVPQDTVLFNDTIYYNIAYGRPDATREQVEAAARAAHVHEFILRLPDGYETQVGERGLKLSGGEKQRVAIARTLLKDPRILILDEATSALDTRTERAIQDELAEIARHRTTLVIAHRLSTIVDAHEILVLDAGRVVERGAHADLLSRGGRYAQMWTLQQEAPESVPVPAPT
ncbi:MAG: ABC transporter ATP-binding protein/permease [Xanthomonadaceae bacterium]|jgi:ATP-binding cassette subfamily B protein|nr:ABC transporter ATP-binding protein/permease [Xanthomonadaceae bacterium]